jgi:hypothetical protein
MKMVRIGLAWTTAAIVVASVATLRADVKTQEKSQIKFSGMLGKMVGMFGGKDAREGTVSTVAVQGDRKATTTGQTGQIIDLAEEEIYNLDLDDKSYTVITFAEMRRQMQEAQQRAKKEAPKASEKAEEKKQGDEPQVEVDFNIKETGQRKTINGYDTRQIIMTIVVREKGKTLEQAGGMVLTADSWLAPAIAAMKEVADFDLRYMQKLYGPVVSAESMTQMATALAMYPALTDAMRRFQKEKVNLDGTVISSLVTFDAVKSAEQATQASKQAEESGGPPSMGGLLSGIGRRMARKKANDQLNTEGGSKDPNRATVMTMTTEVVKIEPAVAAADLQIPAGFKRR